MYRHRVKCFQGRRDATLRIAVQGVSHNQVRATTAGGIRAAGGTVDHAPELTRSGVLNEKHARQLLEACGSDCDPGFLVRDRDAIYGQSFQRQLSTLGIQDVPTAPHSPWQNAYAECVLGSIRRECLNHLIVLGERHVRQILRGYVDYYNSARTHLRDKDAPQKRPVQEIHQGRIVEIRRVGGLHHQYVRRAA